MAAAVTIAITLLILLLFASQRVRSDLIALSLLSCLAICHIIIGPEAFPLSIILGGFSHPAVLTLGALYVVGAALTKSGASNRFSGPWLAKFEHNEPFLFFITVIASAALSAFLNLGAVALMLPMVIEISRRTQTSPSKLFIPMAFGALLGGMATPFGSPANLVANVALTTNDQIPLNLVNFAKVGLPALLIGALFLAIFGPRLLPNHLPEELVDADNKDQLRYEHGLEDKRFTITLPKNSPFAEMSLGDSPLNALMGSNIYAVERDGFTIHQPEPEMPLKTNDRLSIHGSADGFQEFLQWETIEMATGDDIAELLEENEVGIATITIAPGSILANLAVAETDFNRRFGVHIHCVRRDGAEVRDHIADVILQEEDELQVEGLLQRLEGLKDEPDFSEVKFISTRTIGDIFSDSEALLKLDLPEKSRLNGRSISEIGISESLQLRIIGIFRDDQSILFPNPGEKLQTGDQLLVIGTEKSLKIIAGIKHLEVSESGAVPPLSQTESLSYAEVTLSPHSNLSNKSLKELQFRRQYGLQVRSVWRQGKAYHHHLRNLRLQFGDAMVLTGPRTNLEKIEVDSDFLVLSQSSANPTSTTSKSLVCLLIFLLMAGMFLSAPAIPLPLSAIIAAGLMVVFKCLSIDDAYQSIEWKALYLFAALIPLGQLLSNNAVELIANHLQHTLGPPNQISLVIGAYLTTALLGTLIHPVALVLIITPLTTAIATSAGLPPTQSVFAIAIAASASFLNLTAHPAHIMIMGSGGYRPRDYIRTGIPLTILVGLIAIPIILLFTG